ncbi:sensor histidine kinase [soil metagenome]
MKATALLAKGCTAFWLACLCASAQAAGPAPTLAQFHHTVWRAQDGAPTEVVTLAQTTDGYLWLGTGSGLFSFDGIRFKDYQPKVGGTLPSSNISAILALPDGGLMIGYRFGGISTIHGERAVHYGAAEGVPDGAVYAFAIDRAGATWAATLGGLLRFDGSRWQVAGADWGYTPSRAANLFLDRDGALWVNGGDRLMVLRAGARRFEDSGIAVERMVMRQSAAGRLLMSDAPGHFRLADDKAAPVGNLKLKQSPYGMLFDREGGLWIASYDDGVQRIADVDRVLASEQAWTHVKPEVFAREQGLSSDVALSALEDREGTIWVGTRAGLDRFRRSNLVQVKLPPATVQITLGAGADGSLWIGSRTRPAMQLSGDTLSTGPGPVPVTGTWRDPDGDLWFGGAGNLWRRHAGRFESVPMPPTSGDGDVQALVRDGDGALWVAVIRAGLFRLGEKGWERDGGMAGFPGLNPLVATRDEAGRTWFGYPAGQVAMLEHGKLTGFGAEQGVQRGNITAVFVRGEHLWIGGEAGLDRYDNGRFNAIQTTDDHGLAGISGIVETAAGELWLSGRFGIFRVPKTELDRVRSDPSHRIAVQRFDHEDGLPGLPQQHRPLPSAIEGTDGRLWFSTIDGVAWTDPTRLRSNPLAPPVTIESLTVGAQDVPLGSTPQLTAGTHDLRIAYTALSLVIPQRVRFRYRLEGNDTGWVDAGGRREAFFTNLGPGHYRFTVIAANDAGVWNTEGASLPFEIEPQFWQTWWFRTLCGMLVLVLLWLLYRARLRQIGNRIRARIEERHTERERIARELHDTLLQSITGLILQFHTASRRVEDPDTRAAMERGLDRAEQVMVEGRDRVMGLRRSVSDEDLDLPQTLSGYCDELAAGSSVAVSVTVSGVSRALQPLAFDDVSLIAREALSNSLMHSQARTIAIGVDYSDASLRVSVKDDGVGIESGVLEAGGRPYHWGMHGMRERALRLGARLSIQSSATAGTSIELVVPADIAYLEAPSWLGPAWARLVRRWRG